MAETREMKILLGLKLDSYRAAARGMRFAASLTPVSAHFLGQESIASDYLRKLPAAHWASC